MTTDRTEYMRVYLKKYRKSDRGKKAKIRADFNQRFNRH